MCFQSLEKGIAGFHHGPLRLPQPLPAALIRIHAQPDGCGHAADLFQVRLFLFLRCGQEEGIAISPDL